jgi:hypothetical protein
MSYLGFLRILRWRIISNLDIIPEDVKTLFNDEIERIKNNPKSWENSVRKIINGKKDSSGNTIHIFDKNGVINEQLTKYWTERRNNSAHANEHTPEINEYTVMEFWSWIKSSHDKFLIKGSHEALLKKTEDIFSGGFPLSVVKKELEDIINNKIPKILIKEKYYEEFFPKFFENLENNGMPNDELERYKLITNTIYNLLENPNINNSLKGWIIDYFVKNKNEYFIEFLKDNIKYVEYSKIKNDDDFIKYLCWKYLFRINKSPKDLKLFCALLKEGLIPPETREEAFKIVLENYDSTTYGSRDIEKSEISILKNCGFQEFIKNEIQKYKDENTKSDGLDIDKLLYYEEIFNNFIVRCFIYKTCERDIWLDIWETFGFIHNNEKYFDTVVFYEKVLLNNPDKEKITPVLEKLAETFWIYRLCPKKSKYYEILNEYGIYELILDKILNNLENFDVSNERYNYIIDIIDYVGFNEKIVEKLSVIFSRRFNPWNVKNNLKYYFKKNPDKLEEFKRIYDEINSKRDEFSKIPYPEYILE